MFGSLIDIYKKRRKYKQLSVSFNYKYAFIGVGNHSINNLYPVIDYLHIPVKYIVTNTSETSDIINKSGWGKAVNNIDKALNDVEIHGVFISASPKSHYSLVKKCLLAGKHVFVEKPPCYSLNELKELDNLQKQTGKQVLVGLQKRYAPVYTLLKKKMQGVQHYSFKYCTGAYPEGDSLFDLFIHPLDAALYLFGEAEIKSVININGTLLIHFLHTCGTVGALELSTDYSWQTPVEQLTAVTKKLIYDLNTTSELLCKTKPKIIAGIPVEKIVRHIPETRVLFSQNLFISTMQHNNIYINGFYTEIERFVNICEGKELKNLSPLESLLPTYKILEALKNKI